MGISAKATPGRTSCRISPHPPAGNQWSQSEKTTMSIPATTNAGRLIPISAMARLVKSRTDPRRIAAVTPTPQPPIRAIQIATSPSAIDTGRLLRRMSFTLHPS
jgi:hypothetical protein